MSNIIQNASICRCLQCLFILSCISATIKLWISLGNKADFILFYFIIANIQILYIVFYFGHTIELCSEWYDLLIFEGGGITTEISSLWLFSFHNMQFYQEVWNSLSKAEEWSVKKWELFH